MTAWLTCVGCRLQGKPCESRKAMRATLKGLSVTSIKWKCREREARFRAGDPVWALTVDGSGEYRPHGIHGEDGSPIRDYFPATVVRDLGRKLLVVIKPGAEGRGDFGDGITFQPTGTNNGFCKIPLSRLSPREGEAAAICQSCQWPDFMGHIDGYLCHPDYWRATA